MAGKTAPPAGESPATDLTAILARLDALEEATKGLAGALADLAGNASKHAAATAPRDEHDALTKRVDELAETVASHGEIIATDTARLLDGDLPAGAPEGDGDLKAMVLKAYRQIEAIANHSNIQLPA